MQDKKLVERLTVIVGKDNVSTSAADRLLYSYDATRQSVLPQVVVYAQSSEEVAAIVRLAAELQIPVLPRGAGSGFTGGTLPVDGGIVLVLTRMNRILEIDTENLVAEIEPGVVTAELQRQVEKVGLFYPPDPASKEFSTMGGNVAECAGGPRCVKYGVTRDYILGLEVVTPQGEIIQTGGKTLKNVVGLDLTRLFVGSEGTLGIITKILVKLLPKPAAKKTMLLFFASINGAARSVSAIISAGIVPATLEFMDKATISCIRGKSAVEIPEECAAVLIVEVDGEKEWLDGMAQRILEVVQPLELLATEVAKNSEESERIWQMRRIVSPSLQQIAPDRFNEDIVVPRSRVPDMICRLEELADESGIPIVNFGHAGDGNIHVNILVDLQQPGIAQKVESLLEKVFAAALALEGSISGEHGIGIAKQRYLEMELSPAAIDCMRRIKQALDPQNILNPGKIFFADKEEHE